MYNSPRFIFRGNCQPILNPITTRDLFQTFKEEAKNIQLASFSLLKKEIGDNNFRRLENICDQEESSEIKIDNIDLFGDPCFVNFDHL